MNNRLLIIDKDKRIFSTYQNAWLKVDISCVHVSYMQDAIELLASETFSVVCINADNIDYIPMLPMVRELTQAHIYIFTSEYTMKKNIEALKNGADSFCEWWSNPEESVEWCFVIMQRCIGERNNPRNNIEFISYKNIVIHLNNRIVYVDDKKLSITTQDYNLLTLLIENPKQVYSCEQILENVWGFETNADRNVLRSAISRLRKKLHGNNRQRKYIISRYNYGYSFDE